MIIGQPLLMHSEEKLSISMFPFQIISISLEVLLSDRDRNEMENVINRAQEIIDSEACPGLVKLGICKNCSYFDFCFIEVGKTFEQLSEFVYLFSFPWWKIVIVMYIQCLECVFFIGIFVGLRKLFIGNKDFFLG